MGGRRKGERGERCTRCFELRLRAAAEHAKANNFDHFATTLTASPHKNVELINQIGARYENYLPTDFRPLFKKSVELSKKLGLYRQNYCGCRFSRLTSSRTV